MVSSKHAPRNGKGRFEPTRTSSVQNQEEESTRRVRTQTVPPSRHISIQDGENSSIEHRSFLEPSNEGEASIEELLNPVRSGISPERGESLHRSRGDSEIARRPISNVEDVSLETLNVNSPGAESEIVPVVSANLARQLEEARRTIRRLEAATEAAEAGPSSAAELPIRGPETRARPNPLRAQAEFPIRNTSNSEIHTAMFHDGASVASSGRINGKRQRNRSNSSSDSSDGHYHGMRPRNVGVYSAKTARAHLEWVRECENVFRIMRREYRSEGSRIRYASQWLPYDKIDSWGRKESEYDTQGYRPTWDQFTEFLLDLIEDPTYRPFRNLQRYLSAVQGDQPIQGFVVHLEQLELEIPVISEEMRHLILLCKMRPSLQQEILKIFPAPSSRDGLVAAAGRIEESHKVRFAPATVPNNRYAAPRTDDHGSPLPRAEAPRGGPNFGIRGRNQSQSRGTPRPMEGRNSMSQPPRFIPRTDANRTSTGYRGGRPAYGSRPPVVCFTCGKPGHVSPNCPAKTTGVRSMKAPYRSEESKK
jgi:hypothetical protein